MLTTEQKDLISRPLEVKQFLLALSIMVERISTLPKEDRDDMFELFIELQKADDDEERLLVQQAMEEIIARVPVTVRKGFLPRDLTAGDKRTVWASHVGERIKELRTEKGMTQAQLAERADIPQSHISRLENGEHSPTHLTLAKLAKAFSVEVLQIEPCVE